MTTRLAIIVLLTGSLALSACTWVRMEPGADDILLLPERRVQDCERLGTVEVSVLARVAGLDRHEEEIEKDLANLARNHAVERGGDTIAALSTIEDGKQRFGVYRCEGAEDESEADEEEEGVTVRGYNG
ncbi:DUF4156 domain-containing protein [Natronospira bacteriovora]|uniref:DUF4156 domain-containing protein n=1 Tax=Natronospira bacteriovora TaxID=3069753 RepID=A0ABU0WCH7_9GAMM|nr:DUF4156 domain-containing protein [Natronospira sp. AB-CW4]MDQ2070635.1 DUF4156 domain-containing protein [Natronospira sp. AB-CW4]